jgi:hypothetical protein
MAAGRYPRLVVDIDERSAAAEIDFDSVGAHSDARASRGWTRMAGLITATAIAAGAAGAAAATLATPGRTHPIPSIVVSGGGDLPTVEVWYSDGTHADASAALARPWQPDRPPRLITVAAPMYCSITLDGALVVAEAAPVNRLAVCVWSAP